MFLKRKNLSSRSILIIVKFASAMVMKRF